MFENFKVYETTIAGRPFVLETGKIVLSGSAEELLNNEEIKKAYLGE